MADEGKQPGTILAIVGVILVALVTAGALFFRRETPLLSLRPATVEARIAEPDGAQNQKIAARLWQDPFAAVAKSLDKTGQRDFKQKCSACKSPLTEKDKDTLIIGVTVLGAPDDAEQRRRTRYAVLAGLERTGFVPHDDRYIGYFLWTQADETLPRELKAKIAPQHTIVPYERLEEGNRSILVLWLTEEAFEDHPLRKLSSLIKFLALPGAKINEHKNIKVRIFSPYPLAFLRLVMRPGQRNF